MLKIQYFKRRCGILTFDDINHLLIDYSTNAEWDVIGVCGRFPNSPFANFQKNRKQFQKRCYEVAEMFYISFRHLIQKQ
jgi:hypothetical protein